MASIYKHQYEPISIYGNVISLLQEYPPRPGLHLDIGCGFGPIAEPVRAELALTYVGFDLAEDGLVELRERGFEAHQIDLTDFDQFEAVAREAIGDRPVASVTCLDTLEHLTNGEQVLIALRRLAERTAASLVISVPNVAHKDLALKLLLGRWDVTEAGLLDHTHVTLYTYSRLSRLMKSVGWREIASRDWLLQHSDQDFPASSPVLNQALPLGYFLLEFIKRANPHAIVDQFVRLYQVDEPHPQPLLVDRGEPPGPFLSVVVTAAGDRLNQVCAVLRCLALQSSQDFEIVIGHTSAHSADDLRTDVLAKLPQILAARTRLVTSHDASRAEILNAAVAQCSGRYFAVLDDAEGINPHWLTALAALSEQSPGAVLQINRQSTVVSRLAPSSLPDLNRFARGGQARFADLAIPTSVFNQLGMRFEVPLLDDAEWSLATEAILLCGISVSPTIDAALRGNGNAASEQDAEPFWAEYISTLAKLNSRALLLPAGAVDQIRRVADEVTRFSRIILGPPLLRQLIEQYAADPIKGMVRAREPMPSERPFLTVITRTQGLRPHTLCDTLMSLAGQSSQDFEIILAVHSESQPAVEAIREMINEFPSSLRQQIRIISCRRPGRAAPLNDALDQAKGQYITVLDDDDFVLSHWVETFQTLASQSPGSLLRATCARQEFEIANPRGSPPHPRAVSWFSMYWPAADDPLFHLHTNATPNMSMAFPAAVFLEDGLRFDESLSTTEDWDVNTGAAMLRGVATTPEVTSIYRWWVNGESSRFPHGSEVWDTNHARIRKKFDSQPILLPPGSASRIFSLFEEKFALAAQVASLESKRLALDKQVAELAERNHWMGGELIWAGISLPCSEEQPQLSEISRQVLVGLITSTSWRWTRPLRRVVRFLNGRPGGELVAEFIPPTLAERQRLIGELRRSTSWRVAFPLRAIGRLLLRLGLRRT
jgi:hypothetical protein